MQAQETDSWLFTLIVQALPSGMAQSIFAAILVFLQAMAINHISNKNRLARQPALIAGMLYILFVSLLPAYTPLSASLVANSFIIWALFELFQIYKKAHAAINIFNLGLAVGLAILVVPSLSVFTLFGVIGIMIIRSFIVRDILQYLIGIVVPVYLCYSIMYLLDQGSFTLSDYRYGLSVKTMISVSSYWIHFGLIALTAAICILSYNGHMLKKSIQIQKKIDLLYWVMGFSFLSALLCTDLSASHSLSLFVPVGLLLSMTLIRTKNLLLAELIHVAGLALLFALHFDLV